VTNPAVQKGAMRPETLVRRVLETQIKPFIAAHRHTVPVRSLALCCSQFLDAYHNVNYDGSVNGELFVLQALGDVDAECVFDVGANVGSWTRLACSAFPNATIHCFEIDEDTCHTLADDVRHLKRVVVNGCGLSDAAGEAWFKSYPGAPALTSMFDYPHPVPSVNKHGLVTTGDCYVESNGIGRINFLKIDVEGAERRVLNGFERTISHRLIDAIQFEYGRASILARQFLRDLYEFLTERGYAIGKILPNYVDFRPYALSDEDFRGLNYLAVLKSRSDAIVRLTRQRSTPGGWRPMPHRRVRQGRP